MKNHPVIRYFASILSVVILSSCLCCALAQTPVGENAGAKAPGIIRIGVALPALQMGPVPAVADVSEGVRGTLMRLLAGPSFEIVPLSAQLPVQIEAEGRQRGCTYVIYSALRAKKSSSGLGILKGVSQVSNMVPLLGAVRGATGTIAAAGTVLGGVAGAASMVKAKSEVSYEYRLSAVGNLVPVLSDVAKTKAAQDGEDVISALLEKAAGAMINATMNSK